MGDKSIYFFFCLLLTASFSFASCTEADEEDEEWADWQNRNEAYFEEQFLLHDMDTETCFVLPSWGQPTDFYATTGGVAHTGCILVDVIEEADETETTYPLYTDSVKVEYSGRLMPTTHYPLGYEFDRSYLSTYDPDVDVPSTMAVNGVVEGFSTAVQHMHRGDKWRIIVPYQLGYGTTARTSIPAYSTLVFEIELIDFWSKKKGDRL
ncbi:MAG: FKBP-type peptidyl-prolyl cis-trans isomerase [Prevotella sp.]|nr:FKBP-type peptidyl-prolyl cis-trans isomerase [Prevotella sp.]